MDVNEIRQRIERGIPDSRVEVVGEEAHYSALIVSPAFEGKTRIEQHQMVYALLRDEMASQAVHALALRTMTADEWNRERDTQEG